MKPSKEFDLGGHYEHSGSIVGAGMILAMALFSTCAPSASAEGLKSYNLTPPEGSVTPGASGTLMVDTLSINPKNQLAEFLLSGQLQGLVPNRQYKVWICDASIFDCSSHRDPEIRTDENGKVTFTGLNITRFSKEKNPISSIVVLDETPGLIPADACPFQDNPCLKAPLSVQ